MKKLVSILLALMMILSMATVVFAEGEAETGTFVDTRGSITINSIRPEGEYAIYRLLDLESYVKPQDPNAEGKYAYKVNDTWAAFFALDEIKAYITIDANGYVEKWNAGDDDAVAAAFAQKALAYANANGIAAEKSFPPSNSDTTIILDENAKTLKFEDLDLGWYLVDSNVGALCGLTTTDKDASVTAKNGTPTLDKQVQEDLTGMWGDVNTADIGQIVNFMSIIHVAPGAENYVLHDKMSAGLTFVHDLDQSRGVTEIRWYKGDGSGTTVDENQKNYTPLVLGTDYTVKTDGFGDDCTFEVEFSDALMATLKANDRLLVYYNAMLNRHAVAGPENGNTNESWLEYADEYITTKDQTTTYTFSIDIVKTNTSNALIDGAEFRIYDAATGGNEIAVVPLLDANDQNPVVDAKGNPMYRRARADETGVDIVVKDGQVTVVGFDNGVYYLEEVEAPEGYSKLTSRKEFIIADNNLSAIYNGGVFSTGSGVHVINKTGNMLPETGGLGTVLFIAFGGTAVLGSGVLLVTKKRMGMIE